MNPYATPQRPVTRSQTGLLTNLNPESTFSKLHTSQSQKQPLTPIFNPDLLSPHFSLGRGSPRNQLLNPSSTSLGQGIPFPIHSPISIPPIGTSTFRSLHLPPIPTPVIKKPVKRIQIRPPSFSATSDSHKFIVKFRILARNNGFEEDDAAMCELLLTCLDGAALAWYNALIASRPAAAPPLTYKELEKLN